MVIGGGALINGPPFREPTCQFFLTGPYPERFQDSATIVWNGICSDVQVLAPREERWRNFMQAAVSRVSLLSVRNSRTRDYLRACGITREIEIVPDVAVLASEPVDRPVLKRKPRVGIAPASLVFPNDFLSMMAKTALANAVSMNPEVVEFELEKRVTSRRFHDNGYTTELAARLNEISDIEWVAFGFGSMYGDAETAAQLAEKLDNCSYVTLNDPLGADAIELIRSLDCVVGFRLHSCVVPLTVGTPFIGVDAYCSETTGTSKLREFMRDATFESRYAKMDEILSDGMRLRALLEQCLEAGTDPVVAAHRQLAERARAHFDKVAHTLAHQCVAVS
jgi:polysaccharide pyruvyl transferase WcaK-like protein